jgi:tetratricopeptide (TPR) repeat protein
VYPIASGRETLIPAIFVLLSLYAFLRPGAGAHATALLAFAAALLSKEQAVVVPGLFVLADVLGLTPSPPGRDGRRWLRRYAPVAAIVGGYALLRLWIIPGGGEIRWAFFGNPWGPLLSGAYALQTLLTPYLELRYEPRTQVWLSPIRLVVCSVAVACFIGLARGRDRPAQGVLLFWLGWIGLSLLPTAGFLVQEAAFAERYTLLAVVGGLGAVAALVSPGWELPRTRRAATVAALGLALLWGGFSWARAKTFRDDRVFHTRWLTSDPKAVQPHVSLGEIQLGLGHWEKAGLHYRDALVIRPDHAHAHFGMAVVSTEQGDFAAAETGYRRALNSDPDFAEAHNNLAALLERRGDFAGAIRHYERAFSLDPDAAGAHRRLAALASKRGDWPGAVAHYRRALEIDPDSLEAANNLAWILSTAPDTSLRDGAEALHWATRAAEATHHQSAAILGTLAAAHAENGDFEAAVYWQTLAIRGAPAGRRRVLAARRDLYLERQPHRSGAIPTDRPAP